MALARKYVLEMSWLSVIWFFVETRYLQHMYHFLSYLIRRVLILLSMTINRGNPYPNQSEMLLAIGRRYARPATPLSTAGDVAASPSALNRSIIDA